MNPPSRFVHVWMPPLVQEISEQIERVIGCGHVSGLLLQRLIQPRAGMAMREPEADQQNELMGSCTKTALSGPDLSDHFPLLFIDLLTHSSPRTRCEAHCAHAIVAAGVRSSSCFVIIAQRPRAILFANAMATRIRGLRASIFVSQLLCGGPKRSTA